MSDKVKGLVVVFEKDVSEQYAEVVKQAIMIIGGVASVSAEISDPMDFINQERVRCELRDKFIKFLKEELS